MQLDMSPAVWQLATLLALALIVSRATVADIRERRIPNELVIVALCAGLVFNTVGPVAAVPGEGLFSRTPGAVGFTGAALGALVGLAGFLPLYLLRVMGAGDVKLMAGIGSFAGVAGTLNLALVILAAGGVQAIGYMLWTRRTQQVLFNVSLAVSQILPGRQVKFDRRQTAYRMPFSLAVAGGLLAYACWLVAGGQPLIRF